MEEVKLVHPEDPEKKVVVATDNQQVEAYKKYGFVEEAELKNQKKEAEANSADASEELTKLKAENKILKAENTRLKNKLEKVSSETTESKDDEQEGAKQPDTQVGSPVDASDVVTKSEEETK